MKPKMCTSDIEEVELFRRVGVVNVPSKISPIEVINAILNSPNTAISVVKQDEMIGLAWSWRLRADIQKESLILK